ncbi:MAG TPA: Rmf/CrpP family protein [Pseudonocardiaceae bacterium]|nr:Rmf/CrpP family protein [Pseudonocardiaceae bacterium]
MNDTNHTNDGSAAGRSGGTATGGLGGAEGTERGARQSPMAAWLASSAAELLGPRLVLATQDQGYAAALNGDHVRTCPWMAADTDRERALRQMWIRGYSAGRTDLRSAGNREQPPGRPRQSPAHRTERRS